jgi:inorganic pyrophosphatase
MNYSNKYLNQAVKVKMDRPMGSKHPRHDFIYPVNYGYIPDTIAPDGHEIDAYVLGVFDPLDEFEGECIAVIHRTNDDDDKLVVVPKGLNYTDEQIQALTEFQERFFESVIMRNSNS